MYRSCFATRTDVILIRHLKCTNITLQTCTDDTFLQQLQHVFISPYKMYWHHLTRRMDVMLQHKLTSSYQLSAHWKIPTTFTEVTRRSFLCTYRNVVTTHTDITLWAKYSLQIPKHNSSLTSQDQFRVFVHVKSDAQYNICAHIWHVTNRNEACDQ